MSEQERLEDGVRILRLIGAYWWRDWDEFDGRTLRDQLNSVANYLLGSGPRPEVGYLIEEDD